jgi:asparagine synthase (glutamine-hydrolysing)
MAIGTEPPPLACSVARFVTALNLIRHRGPDGSALALLRDTAPALFFPLSPPLYKVAPPTLTLPHKGGGDFYDTNLFYEKGRAIRGLFGHHRLAILDRSAAAAQPMAYPLDTQSSGHPGRTEALSDFCLIYNGEIYNHQALRQDLAINPMQEWQTTSDSETVLALYARHGPDMVKRLNGMFAFAIWDRRKKTLFLARDRYGIKPLYYARLADGSFTFASEIKSLLALPGVSKQLDTAAISEHFTFQTTLPQASGIGKTFLRNIHSLEPGCQAELDLQTGHLCIERYWSPVWELKSRQSALQAKKMVHDLLEQAVRRQLLSDAPIGGFLSGGIDSGAITAFAQKARSGSKFHTPWPSFTAGFELDANTLPEEQGFDERLLAEKLARQWGTAHHSLGIEADALPQTMSRLIWHLDDFRAGISYPNYLVSGLAAESISVALSGVGGDELFAGYPWRYAAFLEPDFPPGDFAASYYQRWTRLLSEAEKWALFTPELQQAVGNYDSEAAFHQALKQGQATSLLDQALDFDFRTFLPALLTVEDRLSMAHGLETRVPFLDNDLVDACLSLPADFKLKTHESDSKQSPTAKWLLKEALQGTVPGFILKARKQGFTPPDAGWYRGPLRPYIKSILLSPRALSRGLFQPNALRALLDEHFTGQRNRRFLIWSFLCFEWWQRHFLDVEIPSEETILN